MRTHGAELRAAIVGCGVIGQTHAETLRHVDGITVAALVDARPGSVDAVADQVETATGSRPAVFASLADALAAGGIDVVTIATPSGLHAEQGLAALAAGTHLVVEKPLDVDLARAAPLVAAAAAADARGQRSTVISQHRFDPGNERVRALVEAGALGRITSATASVPWWRGQDYYDSAGWRGTVALDGGGALINQGVHTVDLLLWFLGRPESVSAEMALLAHDGIEVEDTLVATVRFESGALATLHATTAAAPGFPCRIHVMGASGGAVLEDDRLIDLRFAAAGEPGDPAFVAAGEATPTTPPGAGPGYSVAHAAQFADLVAAIAEGRSPRVGVDDAYLALATIDAAYRSARSGRPVELVAPPG